jgi:hypothetical protein
MTATIRSTPDGILAGATADAQSVTPTGTACER